MKNKVNNTLYKLDSKGTLREWEIFTGLDATGPFYSVEHGQKDGKKQATLVYVLSGKNIGKKNETTPTEQCLAEAQALYVKQKERKGYSETIPTTVPMKPMLAHKYQDYKHKITWPALVSQKKDGIRGILHITNGQAKLLSRTSTEINGFAHITDEWVKLGKDIIVDGELYSDTLSFQEITSIVRKSKSTDPRCGQIEFHVFDLISSEPHHQRVITLSHLASGMKHTKVIPWFIVSDEAAMLKKHDEFVASGLEGTMVRNLSSPYEVNKRSYNLLKYKDFDDAEFEIIGHTVGVGKFAEVPTFNLVTSTGQPFEAVPKGTEAIRRQYLADAESLYGRLATIRYFGFTDDGSPRFPVMIGVRDYE